jgi:PIN domain nuclease of toxin-antitoxin system
MKYLLDTHSWIWWHMKPEQLSEKVKHCIQESDRYEELLLSAISLWEFSKLLEKKRLGITCDPLMWLHEALVMPKLRIVPLTLNITYLSTALPGPFHDDPADQIIVATARAEGATVLTRDERILSYNHIESLW